MSSRKKRRLFSVLLAGIMTMSVAANALPVGAEVQESNGPVIENPMDQEVYNASTSPTNGQVSTRKAVGNDGSAEMNEAYANRESLMPIGPSFNVATILEWTAESDPDARYSRASIPLAEKKGGLVVNPLANPEAKLMLCSLANATHDKANAQGSESFLSYSFNYWQYVDSFIYWSGSEEGLFCMPTGEFTDAAHTNGVPVVATLGFPWGTGAGYVEEVRAFCQKAADGSFPVADKMIEIMDYYGFDGYFFNQESYGCGQAEADLIDEMMRYMHKKRPNMLISWYDSMTNSGGVSYQNAVNSRNDRYMKPDDTGNWGVDQFMMNYNWYDSQVNTTISTLKGMGRSQYDGFAGLDVQQNGMNTAFRDHQLFDEDGLLKLSVALYCPNSTLGNSSSGENFHEIEREFYVGPSGDPREAASDPTDSSNSAWVGFSRFFADKTVITKAPFVTNFNTGHGRQYFVDGVASREKEWSYQSNQDVVPSWTWIIDSEGAKLEGGYDFTDAYNGGNSVKFEGSLTANKANDIKLYHTNVAITNGMKLSLTHKNSDGKMKLVAYYGDANTDSFEKCTTTEYALDAEDTNKWGTSVVDLSKDAGKTLVAIGLKVESTTDVASYKVNLGQIKLTEKDRAALTAPKSVTLDDILYTDVSTAEARVYWDKVTGASSYEVYQKFNDGTKKLIMETPSNALYIPALKCPTGDDTVNLEVLAINQNGVRGAGKDLSIKWAYGEEDGEDVEIIDSENVCLNAEVTGVSFENASEPASKALDGTAENGSKWCATNKKTGWMSIKLKEEKTVKRWRVEHAEYGGEASNMNTVDFELQYKDGSGNWQSVKRIQDNTLAVTDIILDTPVTAQEWRLEVYNSGTSPWGAIRIYEWQMFESDSLPQTIPVPMHFASATNNQGATDTFTLKKVPVGQTVKVYKKEANGNYTELASKEAVAVAQGDEKVTVSFEALDFGTTEAGKIYYTTTMTGATESAKLSAPFEAEAAEKSAAIQESQVTIEAFSQPGSSTSASGDDIYTTVTVSGLTAGDIVYVYEDAEGAEPTKTSLTVVEGATSVSIPRVLIPRTGGKLGLSVKSVGKIVSDKTIINTPEFEAAKATISFYAKNEAGEGLNGVIFGIYNEEDTKVDEISSPSDSPRTVDLPLGTYTLKCISFPQGYEKPDDILVILRSEKQVYDVEVTVKKVDKTALNAAIAQTEGLTEADYTAESWAALQTALTAAQAVADKADTTQEEVDAATTALTEAIAGLAEKEVDKSELEAAISFADKMTEADYTPASWEALQKALDAAKAVRDKEKPTQEEVDAAATALTEALEGMVEKADKTALKAAIAEAEAKNEADYAVPSWEALQEALDAARLVDKDENATQEQVNTATKAVTDAIAELVGKDQVDKTLLNHAITEAGKLTEADYTADSWAALQTALKAAEDVQAKADATQTEVDEATSALETAMENLVQVAPEIDTTELEAAIAQAEGLNESNYIADTWAKLEKALEAAKALGVDATQEEVDAAAAAITDAIKGLIGAVVDPIVPVDPTPEPPTDTNVNPDGDWKQEADGTWKYDNGDGTVVADGWGKIDDTWYFFDEEGTMQTGWVKDNDTWYFTDEAGAMQTGWVKDSDNWYFTNETGAMQTGWVKDSDNWYFTDETGAMQTGWVKDSDNWYFTDETGAMQTGWVKDSDNWYFTDETGAMQTGWVKDNDNWYFTNESGAMQTGWIEVDGKWYYCDASGAMLSNTTTPDGYKVGPDGAWIK